MMETHHEETAGIGEYKFQMQITLNLNGPRIICKNNKTGMIY